MRSSIFDFLKTGTAIQHILYTTMQEAGVSPDVMSMNAYIGMLLIEGNYTEAQRVVDQDMPQMNIKPDHITEGYVNLLTHTEEVSNSKANVCSAKCSL